MLTHELLTNLLHYDPETGVFKWVTSRPNAKAGEVAGYPHRKGYTHVEVKGKAYACHRLAWFYMTGVSPKNYIDHINGNRSDNRFSNLREATHAQNCANSKHANKTGLKGVGLIKWVPEGKRRWRAQITHNKKVIHLGCFHTKEEAHLAYCDAAKKLHGKFFHP